MARQAEPPRSVENDPQCHFATLNCRTAKGSLRPPRRRIAANIAKLPELLQKA